MTTRAGIGFDAHAFAAGRPLVLGGIAIPHTLGLQGHSDADVVIHALVDALLGAAALGDIGQHFPSSDPRWRDAPSATFLDFARDLLVQSGWRIVNFDVTVIAEQPKLGPYVPAMRAWLAEALQIALECASVKAKTTDSLGFAGRGEGIACLALAAIEALSS
jgi:2-C-methyl-D-erythritol 2,4-cyclodiphosphate synthase